ncbi:MAG: hypothetical protein EOO73_31010 [Myxococcales bacterium]|nr:MAG: hypothetical protein EOO73_31010 [Myxococcales bacterium]
MQPIVGRWLSAQGFQVTPEFQTSQGIADLVACQWRRARVRLRQDEVGAFRFRSRLSAALWCDIGDEQEAASSVSGLLARYGPTFGMTQVARELEWMVARGILAKEGRAVYRDAPWFPLHRRLIAVELKLSRTLDAIRQAVRYREFADYAYVALPLEVAIDAKRRAHAEFESTGLGLIGVSLDGVRVFLKPHFGAGVLDPLAQLLAVERFWQCLPRGS